MEIVRQEIHCSKKEFDALVESYQLVFDVVRLVDVSKRKVLILEEDGCVNEQDGFCHCVWGKKDRCANCISARTIAKKKDMTKFEFIGDDIFFVMSKYVEVDGVVCVLELVKHVLDPSLMCAYGKNQFVTKITEYNDKMYSDSLTKLRNRRYFDEQLMGLPLVGLAVVDIDRFKDINDTYGHMLGDKILIQTARCMEETVGSHGITLRFGGDEFVIAYDAISYDDFVASMKHLNETISKQVGVLEHDLKVTISIGGVYGRIDPSLMFEKADECLYIAKKKRNTCVLKEID